MLEQTVIIAGGQGSRLKPLINNTPKLLMDINGLKMIDHQIDYLQKNSIKKIHFCLGFGSDKILDYIQSKEINYTYSIEESPLVTYGALANSKKYLYSKFFVLYSDILTNFDIQKNYRKFYSLNSDFHLILRYTNHPNDSDIITITDTKNVIGINKSSDLNYPYMPIGNTALFFGKQSAIQTKNLNIPSDIFKDYLKINKGNYKITGSFSIDYIRDIGTVDRYKSEVPQYSSKIKKPYKVALLDRDGTLIEDQGNENKINKLKFKEQSLDILSYLQENYYKIFLISNQPGIAKGFFSFKDVERFHAELQHQLIKKGFEPLDGIYFCPHHPEAGHKGEIKKLKVVCDCRKPSIGLVEEIKRDHDLRNSQFIVLGDTFSDYELSLKLNANFYLIKSELTEMEKFLNLNIKPHETNVI